MAQVAYNAMPGAFAHSDRVGPKSHLFQPPLTPSASSSVYLSRSTASITSDYSERPTISGRKRSRHDYSVDSFATPISMTAEWTNGMDTNDSMARSESMDPGSPMPFVNTRYELAGGLDTPTAAAAAAHDIGRSEYSDVGYRKRLSDGGTSRAQDSAQSQYFPHFPAHHFTDSNGRPRQEGYEPQRAGWSKTAIDIVGGVVGKVWEFCKAGAFRGFTAGGGKAYGTQGSNLQTPLESNFPRDEVELRSEMFSDRGDRQYTPIPGQFIEDEYVSEYFGRSARDSTPPRASKRLHISNDDGELAQNWIMVSNATTSQNPTSQSKLKPTARYSMPTASSAGRRLAGTAATRPASRANNRRPLLHSSRATAVSHAGSPGLHSTRPASFASPRSPGGSRFPASSNNSPTKRLSTLNGPAPTASPASIEAQKWAVKMKKEEKEADESIRRFNAQLQAMIREGKEALGTRVEVDEVDELVMEEMVDDGFE